ncbi:MAG: FecR domain-containing protein, partial [Myxococcota bacterium]
AADAQPEARVLRVVGKVEISFGPTGSWRAAQVDDALPPGAALRTGAGARAEVILAAGIGRLYEHSLVRIPEGADAARSVDVAYGAASFDIRHRDDAPFEARTPNAVALVKGTRFTVTADSAASTVAVQRGLVGVREPGSVAREILVHPGFGVTGSARRPFALGLLSQKGDAWQGWTLGAAPPRPLPPAAESEPPPASADTGEPAPRGEENVSIRILAERGAKRVEIVGMGGVDATLTKRDLDQVLRGNSAVLGSALLAALHARGVTPAAFAQQLLDGL